MHNKAIPFKEIQKWASFYSPASRQVNIVSTIKVANAAGVFIKGILADVGCGKKPFAPLLKPFIHRHIGIDHPDTLHGFEHIDVIGTVYNTGLKSNICDSVLCSAVLEHLEEPGEAICEAFRILKPMGHAVYSVPFIYPVHEAPRDFFRYTRYGIGHLFTKAGFEIVNIEPMAGYFLTVAQFLSFGIAAIDRGIIRRLRIIPLFLRVFQSMCYYLDKIIPQPGYTWAYFVVARKPGI